jgi:hypothetical protein
MQKKCKMQKGGKVTAPKPSKKPKTPLDMVGDGGRLDSMDPKGYKKGGKVKAKKGKC